MVAAALLKLKKSPKASAPCELWSMFQERRALSKTEEKSTSIPAVVEERRERGVRFAIRRITPNRRTKRTKIERGIEGMDGLPPIRNPNW
jgi:hypothetical protein